jgi:hypothetical protein
MVELSLLHVGGTVGGIAALYMAYRIGKAACMRELHSMARQGILTIRYNKDHQQQRSNREEPRDEPSDEALDIRSYQRRDSPERRDNWAKHLMDQEDPAQEKK